MTPSVRADPEGESLIRINVLFLGPSRDLAGADSVTLDLAEHATITDVRALLVQRLPRLAPAMRSVRFAINLAFVAEDATVRQGDEVALIPPVSGGADDKTIWVALVDEAIPAERIRDFVTGDPTCGGIVTFEGATRRERDEQHGLLVRLEYEAYVHMARTQLERLAAEAAARWSLGRVAVLHRLGPIAPADASVMIAVAGRHRAESFEACRWLIDSLKREVPIWKKDVFEDGTVRWVEPAADRAGSICAPGAGRAL